MGLLDGKVAIVTGAGHGIGRGHAMELPGHGAHVVVNDLGGSVGGEGASKDADLTVGIIESRGGVAVANYEDVADHEGAGRMIDQAVDTWGRLDILVNNAGIVRDGAIWNMTADDFDAVMRVHVKGTWGPCHWAAQHWRARAKAGETFTGRIINTTSGAGLVGNFGRPTTPPPRRPSPASPRRSAWSSTGWASPSTPSARRRHPHHRHHAGRARGHRARRARRGRLEPHGPGGVVAGRRLAGIGRGPARDRAGHPAVAEDIIWMRGWTDGPTVSNGGKRWDAATLGTLLATDVFGTRAPGLRY